jgi:hypothetical protein
VGYAQAEDALCTRDDGVITFAGRRIALYGGGDGPGYFTVACA